MCSYMYTYTRIYTHVHIRVYGRASPPSSCTIAEERGAHRWRVRWRRRNGERQKEKERHGERERERKGRGRETNKREVAARVRAKGRRIGMRKLKRAVSPPECGRDVRGVREHGESSFVIPAHLRRVSTRALLDSTLESRELTFPRARVNARAFPPRVICRRRGLEVRFNVIGYVDTGYHERKVSQGHESTAVTAAAAAVTVAAAVTTDCTEKV